MNWDLMILKLNQKTLFHFQMLQMANCSEIKKWLPGKNLIQSRRMRSWKTSEGNIQNVPS